MQIENGLGVKDTTPAGGAAPAASELSKGADRANEAREIVFKSNSDAPSILILLGGGRIVQAGEGQYGGYLLRPASLGLKSEEEVQELIAEARAFYVEPSIERLDKVDYLPQDLKKTVEEWLAKLPSDVAEEFRRYGEADLVTYTFSEVKPVVEKITESYIVLDPQPLPGGVKAVGRALRLYIYYAGSRRHPLDHAAKETVKRWKLKYPENEVLQKYVYARAVSARSSTIYFKIVVDAPAELAAPAPALAVEEEGEEAEAAEAPAPPAIEVPEVELEVEMPSAAPVSTAVVTETAAPAPASLVKIYLLSMRLPSKYIVQEFEIRKEKDGYAEVRRFSNVEVAKRLEGLRREAYERVARIFAHVPEFGTWIAVTEEAVEEARRVSEFVRKRLSELPTAVDTDRYSVRAIPIYLEPNNARELIAAAVKAASEDLSALEESIKKAEESQKKSLLVTLQKRLEYKAALLESLRKRLEELEGEGVVVGVRG